MEAEESGRPERPELLVVVVDVANIRPRHKSDVEGQRSSGPTSLTFIDLCLNSIQLAARGAIVVKFADRSLLDALPAADRDEVLRRSELHFAEPDKIFLVPYADRPILAGAHDLEATIISNDRFKDPKLDEFKVSEVRHFRHHYDKADNSFNFPAMSDGRQLDRWWSLQFRDVPDMWFVSDDYLEIDWQLRDRVHEVTFQWHSERLTHRPQVPAPIGTGILSAEDEFDLQADSPPDLVPAGDRFGTPEQAPYVEPARRKLHLPVAFMDDLESVAELQGEEARVVGRLVRGTEGSLVLQWFEGGPHAVLSASTWPASIPEGTWVAVPCRMHMGETVRLELLRGAQVDALSFEEVLTLRTNAAPQPATPGGRGAWTVPGFTRALLHVNLLRQRRGTRRTGIRDPGLSDADTRRLRWVPVFRDGREERVEKFLTDEEEKLALAKFEEEHRQWKSAQEQEQERRRRKAEAARRKRGEDLTEVLKQEEEKRRRDREENAKRRQQIVERGSRETQRRLQEEYLAELAAARRRRIMVVVLVLTIVVAAAIMLVSAFSGGDGAGAVSAVAVSSRAVIAGHVR